MYTPCVINDNSLLKHLSSLESSLNVAYTEFLFIEITSQQKDIIPKRTSVHILTGTVPKWTTDSKYFVEKYIKILRKTSPCESL